MDNFIPINVYKNLPERQYFEECGESPKWGLNLTSYYTVKQTNSLSSVASGGHEGGVCDGKGGIVTTEEILWSSGLSFVPKAIIKSCLGMVSTKMRT